MSNRLFGVNNPVTHCAPKRVRRTWGGTVLTVLILLALAALCGWLWSCVREAAGQTWMVGDLVSGRLVAMAPATQGALMGLLAFVSVLAIFLAVRKVRENEIFCDELRQAQLARKRERLSARRVDVFAPLRAPGEPVPPDDVRRILVACAAEGRCVAKHVRRAQTTLSVEDYGDELELAGRKLDAVIRCVEALTDRLQGHETGRGGLMKAYVTICTDSLVICQAKPVEARSTMEALLAALHHETSAFAHLRDLPLARLHIEVWPEGDHFKTATLNQEAGNA